MDSLHVDLPNAQIHNPKDFSGAAKNTFPVKSEKGGLLWEARQQLPNVKQFVDATSGVASEVDQDSYILLGTPSAFWDGASENDYVRYDATLDTWYAITPVNGTRVYDENYNGYWIYDNGWRGDSFQITKALSNAEIKALNSTPILVVSAPVGKSIVVTDWSLNIDYTAPAFATEDTLWLKTDTATRPQGVDDTILGSTVDRIRNGQFDATTGWVATSTQIIAEKALYITTDSADPTAGGSTISITVNFRLI